MFKVSLILNTRRILVTLGVPGIQNWNLPMNVKGFTIYKGCKNSIEIVVRNNDRKPVDLTGKQIIVTITNPESHEVIWQKPITINNATSGTTTLVLDDLDTDDWPFGYLRYIVLMQDLNDFSQDILYVDQDEGGNGYLEILEGPDLGPVASQESSTFTPEDIQNVQQNYFYSEIFNGNAAVNQHDFGAITLALYANNWTGQVFIQGNIEDAVPTSDYSWFSIYTRYSIPNQFGVYSIPFINFTGILPVTFLASLRWVRIALLPDLNNHGVFNKVMMRT